MVLDLSITNLAFINLLYLFTGKPGGGNEIPLNPDNNRGGNAARNTYVNTGSGVKENFMMFLYILSVILILIILFAVLMFYRDWRKINHG